MSSRANDVFAGTLTVLYSIFGGAGGAGGAAATTVGAGDSATEDEAEVVAFDGVAAAFDADFVEAAGLAADFVGAANSDFAGADVVSAAGDAGALDSAVAVGVVAGVS